MKLSLGGGEKAGEGERQGPDGAAIRSRNALGPGHLGSALSPGPQTSWTSRMSWRSRWWREMGSDRNLGGISWLLIQHIDPRKPGRVIDIRTMCL